MKKTFLMILVGTFALLSFPAGGEAGHGVSVSAGGKSFSGDLKKICNEVMLAVYKDILSQKDAYDNLADFGQQALSQNQYGIYAIEYGREIREGIRRGEFLNFGVTIVRPEDANFHEYGGDAFDLTFPLLDVKFAGYQQTNRQWLKFNIQDIVRRNGDPLLEEQQKYLPLRLALETDKEVYRVGEDIQVTVTLQNVSRKNLWVNSLDSQSLYFLYGDTEWGAVEVGSGPPKTERFVLEPEQKVSRTFVGSSPQGPREFEIYCSYILTFEGVKPFSVIRVKVVE